MLSVFVHADKCKQFYFELFNSYNIDISVWIDHILLMVGFKLKQSCSEQYQLWKGKDTDIFVDNFMND